MIARTVEPELLDSLPADHPDAIRSRRDLRRINAFMGNVRHLARAIRGLPHPPKRILELGTGDGTLMLKLAHELPSPIELWLLDMQPVVTPDTLRSLRDRGWAVHLITARLQDWLSSPEPGHFDLILANLFLHHFSDTELGELFPRIARITSAFISCDPRRWTPALWSTRALWLLGCNHVTRHDAHISVRAGFQNAELGRLWPAHDTLALQEGPAGFASHLFQARMLR